ncbi:chromosomal replication initiation protein [Gimesia maris DSM 8797]|nr:chromosomal replication initiation protein [Gimesia maris DSM 8797]
MLCFVDNLFKVCCQKSTGFSFLNSADRDFSKSSSL